MMFLKLILVRIDDQSSEVIAIENCVLQRINNEALHYHNYKPFHGLGLLYRTLNELRKYDAANYLIRYSPKNGPFLLIFKECEDRYVVIFM